MLRPFLAAASLVFAFAALPADAEASCLTRDRMSDCFEPRGNDAMSPRPNRRLLRMPEIDPRVPSPRLRPLAPPVSVERRGLNRLRWAKRGPDGRLIAPCVGPSCGPFLVRPGCRPPFC